MTTTRATAAVLEAIQALDNGGVEYHVMIVKENIHIIFDTTMRELGFCYKCSRLLKDRRFKECERCRDE